MIYPTSVDFIQIVKDAWKNYDDSRQISHIEDISVKVSTNHVFRIWFEDGGIIIAKISYFGLYQHFVEDHAIINALAINLPAPFENFLAHSLTRKGKLYTFRKKTTEYDVWVVFYNQITIRNRPDRRQTVENIQVLGQELAAFHKACSLIKNTLPDEHKSAKEDLIQLLESLHPSVGQKPYSKYSKEIEQQSNLLLENVEKLHAYRFENIPVFVDWNIGNFSVTEEYRFFSRWDYDWFRMSSRIMDFYFFSRICSDAGDKTVFSYLIDTMMEDRFLIFLKSYHSVYPLTREEVLFMKEAYRFFILNYVIKDGNLFFHENYALRLQQEAFSYYLPQLDKKFNPDTILKTLGL